MSIQEGELEELVHRYTEETWNGGDLDAVEEYVSDDYVLYDPAFFQLPPGPGGVKQAIRIWRHAFPDAHFEIEDTVAEGNELAVRWIATGTHEGELMGLEPTGEAVEFEGFELDRAEDGVLLETRTVYDALGLLGQLGAIPELPLG